MLLTKGRQPFAVLVLAVIFSAGAAADENPYKPPMIGAGEGDGRLPFYMPACVHLATEGYKSELEAIDRVARAAVGTRSSAIFKIKVRDPETGSEYEHDAAVADELFADHPTRRPRSGLFATLGSVARAWTPFSSNKAAVPKSSTTAGRVARRTVHLVLIAGSFVAAMGMMGDAAFDKPFLSFLSKPPRELFNHVGSSTMMGVWGYITYFAWSRFLGRPEKKINSASPSPMIVFPKPTDLEKFLKSTDSQVVDRVERVDAEPEAVAN